MVLMISLLCGTASSFMSVTDVNFVGYHVFVKLT